MTTVRLLSDVTCTANGDPFHDFSGVEIDHRGEDGTSCELVYRWKENELPSFDQTDDGRWLVTIEKDLAHSCGLRGRVEDGDWIDE